MSRQPVQCENWKLCRCSELSPLRPENEIVFPVDVEIVLIVTMSKLAVGPTEPLFHRLEAAHSQSVNKPVQLG